MRSHISLVPSSIDSEERVGGAYRDTSSGYRFVIARPADRPALWQAYLEGARSSYREGGVESVLEYDEVRDGASTTLFFVAVQPDGRIAGGVRAQGPYTCANQAHALREWGGRPGTYQARQEISERLSEGVIEMKTGWVRRDAGHRRELIGAIARTAVHAMNLLSVRYALGTAGSYVAERWRTTGAQISAEVSPVAYPDHRYRTVLMWWDAKTYADLAVPAQLLHIIDESAQLMPFVASSDSDLKELAS